jgi:hypothetical protein
MKAYVIKSLYVSEQTPDSNGNYVRIAGRTGGLISWLLSQMAISPTVELCLKADILTFAEGSLEGFTQYHTPLQNICSTFYGYTKPWKEALVLGAIIGALTFWIACIPGIIIGILYYYLNKTLTIGFTTKSASRPHHINFKRSIIEGQNVDEAAVAEICRIIQGKVEQHLGNKQTGQSSTPTPPFIMPTPEKNNNLNYYYTDAQSQPKGPFSYDELINLEKMGSITLQTNVIVEGSTAWNTWEHIKSEGKR